MYYIIESTGETRQMWGPYQALAHAKKKAGARHTVVCGRGLSNGLRMTRGTLNAALGSGRIWTADGTDKYALA